jgi:hypothetical protein
MAAPTLPSPTEQPLAPLPPELWPKIDHLVTEDDTPVDSIYHGKQMRLLTQPLYDSWAGPGAGRPFLAVANVGLFYALKQPPLVPDTMLSLDVEVTHDFLAKRHRSYFLWEFGKRPEAVIEIVSNKEGGEGDVKMLKYAQIGIPYYAIFDLGHEIQAEDLRLFALREGVYAPLEGFWLPAVGLGLVLWRGSFEGWDTLWLRWCDHDGRPIPTGAERSEQERQRTAQERQRAEQERQRAEQEGQRAEQAEQRAKQAEQRAERLAAQLRELGIDPNQAR